MHPMVSKRLRKLFKGISTYQSNVKSGHKSKMREYAPSKHNKVEVKCKVGHTSIEVSNQLLWRIKRI